MPHRVRPTLQKRHSDINIARLRGDGVEPVADGEGRVFVQNGFDVTAVAIRPA
jgi:hypothetical protein